MAMRIRFSMVLSLLKLARLHAVSVGFFMFLIGAFLAWFSGTSFPVSRFVLGYVILFTAQLSVSYSNDYYDVMTNQYPKGIFFPGEARCSSSIRSYGTTRFGVPWGLWHSLLRSQEFL